MTIYQRDRDFHQMFAEIDVDVVPLRFVKDITCFLNDGTTVILSESDFTQEELKTGGVETIIRELTFYDNLTDLQIRIDYDRVEKDVVIDVENLLNRLKK
jgi:hypothetical protein